MSDQQATQLRAMHGLPARESAGTFIHDFAFDCTMRQSNQLKQVLAEVNRSICRMEMRITRQIILMERLARGGRDTTKAHALLNVMKAALAVMYARRRILVHRLN
jgi:hypothetical protein